MGNTSQSQTDAHSAKAVSQKATFFFIPFHKATPLLFDVEGSERAHCRCLCFTSRVEVSHARAARPSRPQQATPFAHVSLFSPQWSGVS